MTRAQQELFNRGLSPANNSHHGKAYRLRKIDEKREEKKRERKEYEFMHLSHDSKEV
jgi:hypothetical protein